MEPTYCFLVVLLILLFVFKILFTYIFIWLLQAGAFDAACIGKKAGEVSSLLGENGYGNADLKSAGCTVLVNGFVKAAAKIG